MSEISDKLNADAAFIESQNASHDAVLAVLQDFLTIVRIAGPIVAVTVPGAAVFIPGVMAAALALDEATKARTVTKDELAKMAAAAASIAAAAKSAEAVKAASIATAVAAAIKLDNAS